MALAALLAALLSLAPPTLRAGTADAIAVDGVLDEASWATAEVAGGFTQFRPDEGAPATRRTEVRVLRGPDALYVGATMYDDPEGIRTTLSRRDNPEGDFFLVAVDAYGDGRSAYEFAVTASNVQFDAINTGDEDPSWDAVWTSATRVTSEGWVAELAIPYSQLRFTGSEATWGVNFVRMVRRLEEQTFWVPLTREREANFLEDFGRLEGVAEVTPQRVLQALPYSLARTNRTEASTPGSAQYDLGSEVGADLKVGLASNVVLDVTVNPDFGQVEADPAQLNLSTFEQFFSERRPFFLEGTQVFDLDYASGDGALLYTRRIGGSGPIIGAAKLTGRTNGGLSFGALGAATGFDFDPSRAYAAARLKQELPRQSYVGLGATAFSAWTESRSPRSAALAADWGFRLLESRDWLFEGTAATTARDADEDDLGYALYLGLDKVQGFFKPGFGVRVYSDRFALNDVGRFRQADLISLRGGTQMLWNRGEPVGPFRRLESFVFGTQEWRYTDGTSRGFNGTLRTGGQLLGFQEVGARVEAFGLGGYDVRETRGLDPVANVSGGSLTVDFGTDSRRQFRLYAGLGGALYEDGATNHSQELGVDWIAGDRLTLSLEGYLETGANVRAWVTNEGFVETADGLAVGAEAGLPGQLDPATLVPLGLTPEASAALFDGVAPVVGDDEAPIGFYRPIFGARDTRSASLTTRANLLFSADLSLQLYGQLFSARGRFDDFRLLAGPDDLRPFDAYPRRRDFAFSDFNLNAVLRWEYRPGSSLYVVWAQSRGDSVFEDVLVDDRIGRGSPFGVSTPRQFRDTFGAFPNDTVLIKLSYLFMG
jgi:hypothetical protein